MQANNAEAKAINKANFILCKHVETFIVNNIEEIKIYHDNFIKNGFEGIMIRDINGLYEINKRSK